MKKIIIFILLFLIYNFLLECKERNCNLDETIMCPIGIKYPYRFCNIDTEPPQIETHCADDPDKFAEEQRALGKDLFPRRIQLPLCVGLITVNIGTLNTLDVDGVKVSDPIVMTEEFKDACDQWNCLCGFSSFDYGPNNTNTCDGSINLWFY